MIITEEFYLVAIMKDVYELNSELFPFLFVVALFFQYSTCFSNLVFFVPDRGNGKTIVRSENRYRGGISSMVASKPMFSSLPAGMYLRKLTSSKAYVLTNLI